MVELSQGDELWSASPLFVSSTRIDALIPPNAPLGPASLTVNYRGDASDPVVVPVVPSALGLYRVDDQEFNALLDSPLRRGSQVTLRATGLGTIRVPSGRKKRLELFVGGRPARVQSAGPSECCRGVEEITFNIPNDAPSGCGTPVHARLFGSLPSNMVPLSVGPDGEPCPALQRAKTALLREGRAGLVILARTNIHSDFPELGAPTDFSLDIGMAGFMTQDAALRALEPFVALPPPGSCRVHVETFGSFHLLALDEPVWTSILADDQPLDVGPGLDVQGETGERVIQADIAYEGLYTTRLGGSLTGSETALPLFLETATYTVSAPGGPHVAPFSTTISIPEPVQWTNGDRMREVNRGRDLTIRWTGGNDGTVLIAAFNVDRATRSSIFFFCREQARKGEFTVPAAVLQAIPPTRRRGRRSAGALFVGTGLEPNPVTFAADGLDFGAGIGLSLSGRTVRFR
jgi:uncharacterized protein (TIGR03437 family)